MDNKISTECAANATHVFFLLFVDDIAKPRPVASTMDLVLDGCLLWDALATLAASDHTDPKFRKLLCQMGDGSAAADNSIEWGEEDDFWDAAAAKEDGAVYIAPEPVSLAASVGLTYFVV